MIIIMIIHVIMMMMIIMMSQIICESEGLVIWIVDVVSLLHTHLYELTIDSTQLVVLLMD